jgi:Domain of unknown function (DUF4349)
MRQREEHALSADARRELEALDRALAGEGVDPDLAGLETLVREMRAARPEPGVGFAAELDERAANGFAGDGPATTSDRLRAWLAGMRPMQVLVPAGAIATIAVVVAVAVIRSDGGGGPAGDTTMQAEPAGMPAGGAAAGADQPPAAARPGDAGAEGQLFSAPGGQALDAAGGAAFPPSPDRERLAPGRDERAIERSASIGLSADGDEFEEVADGVVEVTDRYRGLVIRSDETTSGETSQATFELAIPSDRLQQALADLSELAHVESRSEGSLDITAPTVSARANLTDAQAEVDSLLRQLAEADTPGQTREIRARLDIARAQVAEARDDLRRLTRRAEFATVLVTVTSDGSGDGDWGVDEALEDVGDILSTAAGVVLVSLAVLVPLALVLALIALAYRLTVRRGRERALDSPAD